MPAPDYAWLPEPVVRHYLGGDNVAQEDVDRARESAADLVEDARPDVAWADLDEATVPPRYVQGALLLAARLHSRKGTPAAARTGYDGAAGDLIASYDPDAARLLGVGRSRQPFAQVLDDDGNVDEARSWGPA